MNRRATYILIGAFVVLAGFAYYLSINPEAAGTTPTPTTGAPTQSMLWTLDPANVSAFTITDNAKQVKFTAAVDANGVWSIIQPTPGPGSQETLGAMPPTLGSLFVSRTITETTDLTNFGLAPPVYTLEVMQKGGATLKASIGNKTPTGESYYVLREGEKNAVLVSVPSLDTLIGFLAAPPAATATPVVTATLPGAVPTLDILPGLTLTPNPTP